MLLVEINRSFGGILFKRNVVTKSVSFVTMTRCSLNDKAVRCHRVFGSPGKGLWYEQHCDQRHSTVWQDVVEDVHQEETSPNYGLNPLHTAKPGPKSKTA